MSVLPLNAMRNPRHIDAPKVSGPWAPADGATFGVAGLKRRTLPLVVFMTKDSMPSEGVARGGRVAAEVIGVDDRLDRRWSS